MPFRTYRRLLQTRAAEEGLRPCISTLLDDLAVSGITFIRAWAFCDGATQWNPLQTHPGVYDDHLLNALDWLVGACRRRGLRMLLAFTNYWPHYGGLAQYVRWSSGLPDAATVCAEQFYVDSTAQGMYQDFVTMLLTRVNTHTGDAYSEDPTIFAWEIINEPRCEACTAVDPCAMRSWLHAATAHVKSLAPYQLVTIGSEGFWGRSTPDLERHGNPYPHQTHGCDWAQEIRDIPELDFTSIHVYPEHWLRPGSTCHDGLNFAKKWIRDHSTLSRQLGKPMVVTEFGSRAAFMMPCDQQHEAICRLKALTGDLHSHNRCHQQHQQLKYPDQQSWNHDSKDSLGADRGAIGVLISCIKKAVLQCTGAVASAGSDVISGSDMTGHQGKQSSSTCEIGAQGAVKHIVACPAGDTVDESCQVMLRAEYLDQILATCFEEGAADGAALWMVATPDYGDYDGFTTYQPDAVTAYLQSKGVASDGECFTGGAPGGAHPGNIKAVQDTEGCSRPSFQDVQSWSVMEKWCRIKQGQHSTPQV